MVVCGSIKLSTVSFEFLKAELSGEQKARVDSYLNSPLYYLLTGRKGARLYKNHHSALVVCAHPHIEDRLLVFPEIGKADYELTASVLNMLSPPKNGVQLARYSEEEIKALQQRLSKLSYTNVSGVTITEEHVMDWRYPVHILDTQKIAALEGRKLKPIRTKFNKAAQHISHIPLTQDNALRFMTAVLKFWEGNMVYNAKDTDDMAEFYHAFFKIVEERPEDIHGLFFLQGRKPLGFCVWDQIGPDVANSLINLGDTSVTGLSDYQMVALCRDLDERDIRYVNVGGSETRSLDAFKAKYQPEETLKILSADVMYRKPETSNIEVHELVAEG